MASWNHQAGPGVSLERSVGKKGKVEDVKKTVKGQKLPQSEQYGYFRIHQKKDCYGFMVAKKKNLSCSAVFPEICHLAIIMHLVY